MYFVVSDKKSVAMRPCDLGPFFLQRIEARLRYELEGSLSKNHDGTIVHIFRITDRSKPKLQDGTGFAVVEVKFEVSSSHFSHIQLPCRRLFSGHSRTR